MIPCQVKDLCRYIASKATWNHTDPSVKSYQPCWASQDTIEIQMGRSKKFVTAAKKKALELGWIQVLHREGKSDYIYPCIGRNDPNVKVKEKRERWAREDIDPIDPEI